MLHRYGGTTVTMSHDGEIEEGEGEMSGRESVDSGQQLQGGSLKEVSERETATHKSPSLSHHSQND